MILLNLYIPCTKIKLSVIFLLLLFGFIASASAGVKISGDSLVASRNFNSSSEKQWNAISTMNNNQLIALVDLLLDEENVPFGLINQLNFAIEKLNANLHKRTDLVNLSVFPAPDFYENWEIDQLFPSADMFNFKGDTSITIALQSYNHQLYNHPFDGSVTSYYGWRGKS